MATNGAAFKPLTPTVSIGRPPVIDGSKITTGATGNPDINALAITAARKLGEQALKQGLLSVEITTNGGVPVVHVTGNLRR